MCNFKELRVAEIAHPTTTAQLIGRSMSSDMTSINLLRAEIETAHSSKLVGAFVKAIFYHCVIGAADDVTGRMRMLTRADHVWHANPTLVDRVDLATPLSLSSQLAPGLSALAPAQRAGAQRLRALA
jgi:hypothetical protein